MTGSDRKWAKVPAPGSGRALCGPAERMGPQGREGEPGAAAEPRRGLSSVRGAVRPDLGPFSRATQGGWL